ncbi:MoaD/ThiS family protein [Parasphingorhabdus sp. DH2-15]|uniref:MoaD/ThiS family protein n=1 Tax=Parasphingorhabdus sp. DH2-15 TaxID=3444112 RepID=UPI003F683022
MQIQLLFFGAFGDVLAEGPRDFADGISAKDVATILANENAAFAAIYAKKGSRIAVNQNICLPDKLLKDNDILAFLAPVSGG